MRQFAKGEPHKRGPGRRFVKGRSGNPGGRPRGSPTLIYNVRAIFAAALEDEAVRREVIEQLRALLKDPKTLLAVIELAAKLNGELRQDQVAPVTTVNVYTNVRPEKLRGNDAALLAPRRTSKTSVPHEDTRPAPGRS